MPTPLAAENDTEATNGRDVEFQRRKIQYGWDKLSPEAIKVIRAHYCGMMSYQDKMLGRLLDYLEEKGLVDNTVILYTADHGDMLGDFGRFFKTCMFDGSVKVPFIIKAPGFDNDGNWKRDQLVGLQDVLPTLCSISGVPVPEGIAGLDVSPYFEDPEKPGRDFYVTQTMKAPTQKYMVRTPRWKYVYTEIGGTEELYDVTLDDYELVNMVADPECQQIRQELRSTLISWCEENQDLDMLDGDDLVISPLPLEEVTFRSNSMGWRKY